MNSLYLLVILVWFLYLCCIVWMAMQLMCHMGSSLYADYICLLSLVVRELASRSHCCRFKSPDGHKFNLFLCLIYSKVLDPGHWFTAFIIQCSVYCIPGSNHKNTGNFIIYLCCYSLLFSITPAAAPAAAPDAAPTAAPAAAPAAAPSAAPAAAPAVALLQLLQWLLLRPQLQLLLRLLLQLQLQLQAIRLCVLFSSSIPVFCDFLIK